MFPAWVGSGRGPLCGIPVSLDPKTPGWRAGMCVWLQEQTGQCCWFAEIGPRQRPSGGRRPVRLGSG